MHLKTVVPVAVILLAGLSLAQAADQPAQQKENAAAPAAEQKKEPAMTKTKPAQEKTNAPAPAKEEGGKAQNGNVVEKIVICTGVQDREPVGEAAEFDSASVTRVFCWTKVSPETVPATIKVVWYADGQKVAEVPLEVKYSPSRTWSSKAVGAGKWKADITSESGDVLSSKEFTVK